MIALGANVTAVLHYYSLHDRESETRAAVASREVWLKQTAEVCRFDALPGVDYAVELLDPLSHEKRPIPAAR